MTIFVPGKPTHYKGKGHRYAVSQHTKDWRERTASRLLPYVALSQRWPIQFDGCAWSDRTAKFVAFVVYSRNAFDDDNLKLVCSGCRDALKDMCVVNDDRSSAGHTFLYTQVVTRKAGSVHGIAVRVALAKGAE